MDWVQTFYTKQNLWSSVYTGPPLDEHHEQMAGLAAWLGPGPKTILELGAGGGQRAAAAAGLGHHVTAIELVPSLAEHCRTLAGQVSTGSLEVLEGDFYTMELPDTFDAVCYWDGFGIGSDSDQQRLLRRIATWLKPHGQALIDIYTPWFWHYANGQTMRSGETMRRYSFDAYGSRMIDSWWPLANEAAMVSQTLRCYAPIDLQLLLTTTGLELREIKPGCSIDYATGTFVEQAPLHQAMSYLAVLKSTP